MNRPRFAGITAVGLAVSAAGLWFVIRGPIVPEVPDTPSQQHAVTPAPATRMVVPRDPVNAVLQNRPSRQTPVPADLGSAPTPLPVPVPVAQNPFMVAKTTSVASVPAPASLPVNDPSVTRFADASIPMEKRVAELEQLGKDGSASAVQKLMSLGDTDTYMNYKAVESLGNVKTPEVATYLAGKTADKDPRMVSCAVQSLVRVQGAEAVTALAEVVAANRQRPDGYQDMVCSAGVKALGETASPKALPVLAEELEKTAGKTLSHDYGSQVVAAMKTIPDTGGVPALEDYAARLRQQKAAMRDNPMGQRYLEGKIKEVEDAVAFINAGGR